jgi:WD repeat-containing protein 48
MQVNDAIIVGQNLVSCSSDTTLKVCCFSGPCSQIFIVGPTCFIISELSQVWNCLSDGACTKTLRQHSDYVIRLAAAEKNVCLSNL